MNGPVKPPSSHPVRAQIESWVRPLYAELDGVDTFPVVERRAARVARLLDGEAVDEVYLELLLLFHGTVKGLGSTDPRGRWWLFLRGLGIADVRIHHLSQGLARWEESPAGPEEEALHDAVLLEEVGVLAAASRIWRAGRKRVALTRAVSTLDAGPVPERFRTAEGRRLARRRRAAAEAWISTLRADALDD